MLEWLIGLRRRSAAAFALHDYGTRLGVGTSQKVLAFKDQLAEAALSEKFGQIVDLSPFFSSLLFTSNPKRFPQFFQSSSKPELERLGRSA